MAYNLNVQDLYQKVEVSSANIDSKQIETEAARYDAYWNNLESGKASPYPGLSEADVAAWDFANSKLNEHITIKDVDTDAVVKLRADEMAKQDAFLNGDGGNVDVKSGSKTAKEVIGERMEGMDLDSHPTQSKQLSSARMKELKNKIDNRTATKEEYEIYDWNKRIRKRRGEGVKDFWSQERERIIHGETPTRNWTEAQIKDILEGKTPTHNGKPMQGHHTYSVSQYPHLANKGEGIYPVTANEHLYGWHGGNYKNSLPGEPILDINDLE